MQATPREIKINERQTRVLNQYTNGKTQKKIADLEGISRKTVFRDIQMIKTRLQAQTKNLETIQHQTHANIQQNIKTIKERAEKTSRDADAAKLYKVALEYQRLQLEFFTPDHTSIKKQIQTAESRLTTLIDFFINKAGPEILDGFEEYWIRKGQQENWYLDPK